jgi:hypothetical protein
VKGIVKLSRKITEKFCVDFSIPPDYTGLYNLETVLLTGKGIFLHSQGTFKGQMFDISNAVHA